MEKINIPCVILAGGKSSRLGIDKTQITFGGQTLSQWLFTRLEDIFENLYISVKQKSKFNFEAPFIVEESMVHTPIAGMINAFKHLEAQEIMFVSVDTPFITRQTLMHIASIESDIVYAQSTDKAHYLISKWKRSLADSLTWAFESKNYALHRIIESHHHEAVIASDTECFNINTMEDYDEALRLYSSYYSTESTIP